MSSVRMFILRRTLHGLFQFLCWPEADLLAGLDLDRLTGRRVPSHPSGSWPYLEDAKASQADFVALLEVLGGECNEIAQHGLSLLLRKTMALGQIGGEVLECDGGLSGS